VCVLVCVYPHRTHGGLGAAGTAGGRAYTNRDTDRTLTEKSNRLPAIATADRARERREI